VAQTDVSGIWAAPRRARYRVYLIGIASDVLLLSVALLLAAHAGFPVVVTGFLKAVALSLMLGIMMQFHVYMRTDIYFVLLDALKCHNLQADAAAYLRGRLALLRLRRRPPDSSTRSPRVAHMSAAEERKIRVYAYFMTVGMLFAVTTLALYSLPILIHLWMRAGVAFWSGLRHAALGQAVDGAATLLHQVASIVVFAVAFRSSQRARSGARNGSAEPWRGEVTQSRLRSALPRRVDPREAAVRRPGTCPAEGTTGGS
jgi:putative peptide zinc metalloprotease protein